jgi:hypothetical protein
MSGIIAPVDAKQKAARRRQNEGRKMKRTEKFALGSAAAGVVAGLALNHWADFLPTWCSVVFGLFVAAAIYKAQIEQAANESIVDSKAINQK